MPSDEHLSHVWAAFQQSDCDPTAWNAELGDLCREVRIEWLT